jgi:hypothetical protein
MYPTVHMCAMLNSSAFGYCIDSVSMSALPRDVDELLNDLAAILPLVVCPVCGLEMVLVNWAFSSPSLNGKIWTLPLPVCLDCGPDSQSHGCARDNKHPDES